MKNRENSHARPGTAVIKALVTKQMACSHVTVIHAWPVMASINYF